MKSVKEVHEIPNYRKIDVYYLAPTNHRGARICISEKYLTGHNTQRKYYSYCYRTGDTMQQGYQILIDAGFNVICRGSDNGKYFFLCDNWGDDFIEVKNL
tara:strand:- start:646 stop:945 length:300 start_codon:yes stop_codon:yes gene_type:complete